jgi:class 3 adenylate cyclase/HAMP domain-containing protein
MKIRDKIILVVLPLLVAPFVFMGFAAALAARGGITDVATSFLQFKAEEVQKYAATQWGLLEENALTGDEEFVTVAKEAVASYARGLVRTRTELILAVDNRGTVVMATRPVELKASETAQLAQLASEARTGWVEIAVADVERVAQSSLFEPFGWYLLVTEARDTFYSSINRIFAQSAVILASAALLSMILLAFFSSYLTKPLRLVVVAMREVISRNDLSKRVPLIYGDEIGELGHTFNLMTGELEQAYNQIKTHAFKAVVAQKREQRIRNIFQKYVPNEVIDQYFSSPDSMLVGDYRVLAVLFSDIRGFTALSEKMTPEIVVESLNRYFSMMVDAIMNRNGIVDKYIGDAIMAFFGAPVRHENDPLLAVEAGLDMLEVLEKFNQWQVEQNRPKFQIGIGINYGVVTVGNIGSEQKMDYTIIGDMVNLASRLEQLTKTYRVPFIISEAVYRRVREDVPCRQIDTVAVKGKQQGVRLYTPSRSLSKTVQEGWRLYHDALEQYHRRFFDLALDAFLEASSYLVDDIIIDIYMRRCQHYIKNPPGDEWKGITVMEHK